MKNTRRLAKGLKLLVAVSALAAGTTWFATAMMFTPGGYRVSETGAAVYEIPIKGPPGIAGMEPRLSLVYSSQQGNGLLGVGWSLSGLLAITRCPRTMAQDGVRGGVNYDGNDRYCLDGQRLVAISGSYGADGTEYRYERESFSKIISYGTAGSGPAWFKAWTKSGQILEYGNTADSRIEAQGKSTVRVWALNKASDTKGNYFSVSYAEDSVNGTYSPTRVDYGGNTASIRFAYESRPDTSPAYVAGSLLRTTNRLSSVLTYVGESVVTEYRLAYEQSTSTQRSRLTGISECSAGGAACFPAVVFTWQGEQLALSDINNGAFGIASQTPQIFPGDYNGDGRTDVLYLLQQGDGYYSWRLRLSTGTSFTDLDLGLFGTASQNPRIMVGDYDGDGRADVLYILEQGDEHYSWRLRLSTGTNFGELDLGLFGTASQNPRIMVGDYNGDGRADVLYILEQGDGYYSWRLRLSTGTSFTDLDLGLFGTASQNPRIMVGDYDGDGRADVLYILEQGDGYYSWRLRLSTGTNFGELDLGLFGTASQNPKIMVGDYNGDGRADVLYLLQQGDGYYSWRLRLATGTNFSDLDLGLFGTASQNPRIMVADYDGDGKADVLYILQQGDEYLSWRMRPSTGTAFGDVDLGLLGGAWQQPQVFTGDYNGDGKVDVLYIVDFGAPAGFEWRLRLALPVFSISDLLTAVTDGLGKVTSFAYKALTDSSVYTKGFGAAYPLVDLQAPLYVVSSVSSSNGSGGNVVTNYAYGGLKAALDGRDLLGFAQTSATSVVSGVHTDNVKTITTYRQDFPFTGLPCRVERHRVNASNGDPLATIALAETTYGLRSADGTASFSNATLPGGWGPCAQWYAASQSGSANRYFFPFASQTDEKSYEVSGSFVGWVRTVNQFNDDFGNASSVVVSHLNSGGAGTGYSKTTTNTFTNDATNWLLGRLTRSTVQSATP